MIKAVKSLRYVLHSKWLNFAIKVVYYQELTTLIRAKHREYLMYLMFNVFIIRSMNVLLEIVFGTIQENVFYWVDGILNLHASVQYKFYNAKFR